MPIRPTPTPRTRAIVRRRVSLAALGAGSVAAGLAIACAAPRPDPVPPQANCMGRHAGPCQPDDFPGPSPQPAPEPPPAPPPQQPQPPPPPALAAGVSCRAVSGSVTVDLRFQLDSMRGTLSIDGRDTRRFDVKAIPSKATYSLVFVSYGSGDVKPATEKLTAGKSVVARLVAAGDDEDLYFDVDVHPRGATTPIRCTR